MELNTSQNKPHHTHDCCDQNDTKVFPTKPHSHDHDEHDHSHDGHSHAHADNDSSIFITRWPLWISLVILISYLVSTWVFKLDIGKAPEVLLMITAYVLAGYKTIATAFRRLRRLDLFNEFSLMTIATFGAFYIGEFSEGVAVMLFYEIGELFQDMAVSRSKRSIKALLDVRPEQVTVIRNSQHIVVPPSEVKIGETILVKAGEKVALDGTLTSASGTFNTAALTGEATPDTKISGQPVLAGMINTDSVVEIGVTALFRDSKLSRILEMVQEATARKAPTQLLISKLAKIYTPIVFGLALFIVLVPFLLTADYNFQQWLYRGMVFLVIACPCALTISIPLGYFGGIGLASRNGILIKGSNFLDTITKIDTLVTDKTGTLTKGIFEVSNIDTTLEENEFLFLTASLESYSTHPVAKAVIVSASHLELSKPSDVKEIAGHGLTGFVEKKEILAGNLKMLEKFNIAYPAPLARVVDTIVVVAIDGRYAGYITISDQIKEDAAETVQSLKSLGIETIMLSGDKTAVTSAVAKQLTIQYAHGDLLPEDKVEIVRDLKARGKNIAFVGDGINDAPVIALSDVGFAMGGLGSDAAIETADIVIQNDQPSKIVSAIKIGHITRAVVYQNIGLAMGVKLLVIILGAGGVATLWEAVFADVGVAMLAILNAFRIQGKVV